MDWNKLEIAAQSATGKNAATFSLHFMNIAPGNNTTTPKFTSVIPDTNIYIAKLMCQNKVSSDTRCAKTGSVTTNESLFFCKVLSMAGSLVAKSS